MLPQKEEQTHKKYQDNYSWLNTDPLKGFDINLFSDEL